ncbi:MAG: glycosyltransferase, partial [Parachlamydia sp.]|nr:glycosyltransferase [Parachlamydia sp.]
LFPRTSQYDVLHHFTRKLYEAFLRAGYSCRLLEKESQLEIPKKDPPDLSIGFNGAPRNSAGEMFCDFLKVPHLACLVDPPYHFLYLYNSPYVITACDDRMGCRLLQTLGVERNLFLPHAVEPELLQEGPQESHFDVIMLATFIDFEKRRKDWRNKYPTLICKAMDSAVEMAFSDPKISFIAAFDTVLEGVHRSGKAFKEVDLNEVLKDLEYYIKGRDRVELVKAVKTPLHLFGGTIDAIGWKDYFADQKNIYVHSPVNYSQALQIMKRSRILLNPSFKNKEGAHERVFAGLASGALVITTESQYLLDRFTEDQELVYYRHPHLESIQENIDKYLADETQRQSLVENGCKKIRQGETWDHRVAALAKELPPLLTI